MPDDVLSNAKKKGNVGVIIWVGSTAPLISISAEFFPLIILQRGK